MAISNKRSLRKPSGARNTSTNPKRLSNMAGNSSLTEKGKLRVREKKIRGGNSKKVILSIDVVNLYDPVKKKHQKAKFDRVLESGANRNYVRRNIITKGTVIMTDKGEAIVMSRPGQDGVVNALKKVI